VNNYYEKALARTENILTRRPAPGLFRLGFRAWNVFLQERTRTLKSFVMTSGGLPHNC
jgi:hypothetical protein